MCTINWMPTASTIRGSGEYKRNGASVSFYATVVNDDTGAVYSTFYNPVPFAAREEIEAKPKVLENGTGFADNVQSAKDAVQAAVDAFLEVTYNGKSNRTLY